MNKEELIKKGDTLLKNIPGLKGRFKSIDKELKDNNHSEDKLRELMDEKDYIKAELARIVKALEQLEDVDQRIICYKYVDDFKEGSISSMTGYSTRTIFKKLSDTLPLKLGKIIYGLED